MPAAATRRQNGPHRRPTQGTHLRRAHCRDRPARPPGARERWTAHRLPRPARQGLRDTKPASARTRTHRRRKAST
eukprot:8836882-Alexandrium_andersonii.AAC.1